ncbi:MAG: threonine ammonia-lyase IlvA [Pauljensenia sp.]
MPVTTDDVDLAARALRGVVRRTALERSVRLSDQLGRDVYLKREDLQKCRSFKVRGAYARMSMLTPAERERGVVCASAGNHAQGVAYACSHLEVRGTIYLPSNTPRQKRQRIGTIGGAWVEQVIVDGTFDRANSLAQEAARASGRVYVHPYDDPMTIAGQGTVAAELAEQMPPDTSCVLVPVGGGGLLAGILTWLKHSRPEVHVIGVEPVGAACMQAALEAGHPVRLDHVDSFVDGTAVGRAGDLAFDVVRELVDGIVTVPEGAVCTEMLDLYQSDGVIAEPAGALASTAARELFEGNGDEGVSAVTADQPSDGRKPAGARPGAVGPGAVVCLVSGGNNDLTRYAEVMERSLRHEGLRHYFLVTFPQQPGALRLFLGEILGPGDDIVHFEYTKKNNRDTGPALVGIDLSHREDIDGLRRRMESSPLHVEEIGTDSELFRLLI